MLLCRVVGSVVATKKDAGLTGYALHVVAEANERGEAGARRLISVDGVGAGAGDLVLVVQGSSARQADGMRNRPVDATTVAIVDAVTLGAEVTYRK